MDAVEHPTQASPNKSAKSDVGPSVPFHTSKQGCTRELAKTHAHETANMRVHRRRHAKCTDRRRTGIVSRAHAPASMSTNSMASSLHRPPPSPTQRQPNDTVCQPQARRIWSPCPLRRVMSTAGWVPWSIGSPDARTSIALPSSTGTVTFMSLNLTLDRTTRPSVSKCVL